MNDILELDPNYSTTRRVIKADHQEIAGLLKQTNKPEDKFETQLFLPAGDNRQGEGGLRIKSYFKVGGIIPLHSTPLASLEETASPLIPNSSPEAKTLITVVTVVYNGEQFLEETILSVINQTYDNVEYIIIDGGSTDGTLDIIKKYEHAIDYWVSEKDKGIYDAMNKGIDLATGEWINFMNAGDGFYSEKVLIGAFGQTAYAGVHILYGNHQVIYPTGKIRNAKAGEVKDLWKGSQFCHQATFVKTVFHKKHKFNLCTKIVADFEFFYKAKKNNASFKRIDLMVAKFEAGGVSDVRRIDSILGWWVVVEKTLKSDLFYIKIILLEEFKILVKKVVR